MVDQTKTQIAQSLLPEIVIEHETAKYRGERYPKPSDVRALVATLDAEGVASCILGTRALQFYGAKRSTDDWQICVPSGDFERALSILLGGSKERCESSGPAATPPCVAGCFDRVPRPALSVPPSQRPLEDCPRLKQRGVLLFVDLLADQQWCFDCVRDARRNSSPAVAAAHRGLPYPALLPFVQSLLDRASEVDLADLVDGLNLPLEWADMAVHVDGDGRRRRIDWAPAPRDWQRLLFRRPSASKRAMWSLAVNGRQARMGDKYPADVWVTRFMTRRRWERRLAERGANGDERTDSAAHNDANNGVAAAGKTTAEAGARNGNDSEN